MGDEAVPDMQGGVGVAATEAGDEVILVGLDGAFCGLWCNAGVGEQVGTLCWNRVENFQAAGAFIVEYLVLGGEAAVGEVGVEEASGSYEFAFTARGEWLR